MTLKQYTFDSGIDGNTLTTANTGASLIHISDSGSAVFDSASASQGMGAKFTSGVDSVGCLGQFDAAAPNKVFSGAIVITLPASVPATGGNTVAQLYTDLDNRALTLYYLNNGNLVIYDRGNTQVANWGGSDGGTITPGHRYRLTVWGSANTTTTGTLNAKLYDDDTGDQLGNTVNKTAINLDTGNITAWRAGAIQVTDGTVAVGVDGVQLDDGGTSELPPIANQPPNITVTANQNVAASSAVTVQVTGSDPDGSIASYAWTVVTANSTSTPTLSGASTATCTFTAPAAGNLITLQCAATDNSGGQTSKTTEVRVPVSDAATPLALDTGTNDAWTLVGTAASKGAALADDDDTTYSQSPEYSGTETEERHRLQPMTPRSTLKITARSTVTQTGGTTKIRLYEGGTMRQEWTLDQSTSAADQDFNVTTPGNISDWGNLWLAAAAVN